MGAAATGLPGHAPEQTHCSRRPNDLGDNARHAVGPLRVTPVSSYTAPAMLPTHAHVAERPDRARHSGSDSSRPEAPDPATPVPCRAPASYLWLKSGIDTFLALVAVLLALPLLGMLAWLVRRDSPGPAFFAQTRVGKDGKPFTLLKFRTMRTDVDPYGESPQTGEDPRITPLGRRLRETSLDELPQLMNVLRGEMAVVGPRPLYVQQAATWNPRQRSRLSVKPGLTGFSQIHGRASISTEAKLEWDVRYVQQISFKTDLWVIWRTVRAVVTGSGLYETDDARARNRETDRHPA